MFVRFLLLVMSDGPVKARRLNETIHERHGEEQSCSEVSRNEIVKPVHDSFIPVKILHCSQLSTVIALGRDQGPRSGCDEQGLDLSLGGCFSSEHPTWENQWEQGILSCHGHLHPCNILVVHKRGFCLVFFFLFVILQPPLI